MWGNPGDMVKRTLKRESGKLVCSLSLQLMVGPWIINLTPVSFSFLICEMNDWTIWLGFKEDAVNLIILWLDIEHKTCIWFPLPDWNGQGSLDYSAMHKDERSSQSLPLLLLTNCWADHFNKLSNQIQGWSCRTSKSLIYPGVKSFTDGWVLFPGKILCSYLSDCNVFFKDCLLPWGGENKAYIATTQCQGLTEGLPSFSFQAWSECGLSTTWLHGRHHARIQGDKGKTKATRGLNCSLEAMWLWVGSFRDGYKDN